MITPLSAEKIKQKFKVEFRSTAKVSQVGGAAVFIAFLREARFKDRLEAEFGKACARAGSMLKTHYASLLFRKTNASGSDKRAPPMRNFGIC